MVIAALVTFAILLVAWILAPTGSAPMTAMEVPMVAEPEVMPEAA